MSDKSVILHVEITLSQADAESVVGSAGTHFGISINLHVPLKRKLFRRWARRVRLEFWNGLLLEIMAKLLKMRGGRHTSTVKMSMLFVVVPRWRSPGLNCRVSYSQKLSKEKDWRDRFCLCVFLTPLDFCNVSFQTFKIYHYLLFRISCRPVINFC